MSNFQWVAYLRVSTLIQNTDRQLGGMTFNKPLKKKSVAEQENGLH